MNSQPTRTVRHLTILEDDTGRAIVRDEHYDPDTGKRRTFACYETARTAQLAGGAAAAYLLAPVLPAIVALEPDTTRAVLITPGATGHVLATTYASLPGSVLADPVQLFDLTDEDLPTALAEALHRRPPRLRTLTRR